MIGRLNAGTPGQGFPFAARRVYAGRRQDGTAILFPDADKQVTAAEIVKVIGKSAQRMEDGFRIPDSSPS